ERPEDVIVPRGLVPLLARLFDGLGGALAVLSGRSIEEIDRLLAPLSLPAAGQHGAELRLTPEGPIARETALERPREWQAALTALVHAQPGLLVEDKGIGIAIHFRAVPAAENEVHRALAGLEPERSGFALKSGKYVAELVPIGCDKGRALRRLMEAPAFAGRLPIAIGDDATDEDAFEAARALGGEALRVGTGTAASAFADPRAVREWLADGAAAL
ncbi:MAG TPA: trehalose-phosphatase, partial [Stellaceae bacterium]|nr:trehalose-phosphatase [Stellaceae bacterium]